MKTLYLDHQYIAREATGQPAHWQQLGDMLAANPEWRLAVSECNLLEIASDGDKARAQRRAAFIDALRPAWMMERLDIQKCEVEAFLWKNHFLADPAPFRVFHEHLSQVRMVPRWASVADRKSPPKAVRARASTSASPLRNWARSSSEAHSASSRSMKRYSGPGSSRKFRCEIPVAS